MEKGTTRPAWARPAVLDKGLPSVNHPKVERPHPKNEEPEEDEPTSSRVARFMDGVITASITALFFGLPIFFTGAALQGLAFEKQIYFYFWVLLGVVSWLIRGMTVGELRIRKTFLDFPILLFFIAYIVSAACSVDIWRSFWGPFNDPSRGTLGLLALILAFYLTLSHFTPRRLAWWLGGLVLSTLLVVAWSFLVLLGVHFLPAGMERFAPISLLGTVTGLVLFLAAMIPLLTVVIIQLQGLGRVVRWLALPLGIVMIGILVLFLPLNNFVEWHSVMIGLLVFAIFILAKIVRPRANWVWLPLVMLVLVFAMYIFGEVNFARVQLPIEASPGPDLSWRITKEALNNNFFLGSGPGTYGYDFSLYRPIEYNTQSISQLRFFQGRGLPFEILPTVGILGSFFFAVALLALISFGFYLLSHGQEYNKVYSLGFWSSTMILVGGVLMVPVGSALTSLTVLVTALGLAVLFWESHVEATFWQLSIRISAKFALVSAFIFLVASVGVVFLFIFIGKALVADVLAGRAVVAAQSSGNADTATQRLSQAMKFMPHEGQYRVVLAQIYLSLANAEASKPESDRNLTNLADYVNAATQLLESAAQDSPKDIAVQESLAQAYESKLVLAGATTAILDPLQAAYERASALEPSNPVFFLKLGQVHESRASLLKDAEQTAELEKARDLFQQSVDKQGNYAAGYLNIALIKEALGDSKDSIIDSLRQAATYDPNNQDIAYHYARMLRLRGGDGDLKQAEGIFDALLKNDDKNQNVRLNLGLLYEATNRKDDAVKEYQALLDQVMGSDDASVGIRKQLQALIDNVRGGKSNLDTTTKASGVAAPHQELAPTNQDTTSVPVAPAPMQP